MGGFASHRQDATSDEVPNVWEEVAVRSEALAEERKELHEVRTAIPDHEACISLTSFQTRDGRSYVAYATYRRDDPVVRKNPFLFATLPIPLSELSR